jgi:hypothetical protein
MNNPEKLATWCTQDGEKQKKRSDGQQIHHYQQNKQPPLASIS